MPFTPDDAEKHHKGLSDKGKRQWARIAESVRKRELKAGKTEEEAAISAIKQANGVIKTNAFGDNDFPRTTDLFNDPKPTPEKTRLYEIETPEEEDLPQEIQNILKTAYFACRTSYIKDNPDDRDSLDNKAYCTSVAWDAVKNEGWEKGANGEWIRLNVNKAYTVYAQTQDEYEVELKVHQGKPFIIVPVTMMVEGVHSGSHGAIYHPIDELGKFPKAWDGIPVVINHPEVNGVNVSANSPDIIDSRTVGRVYNTHVKGSKLKAEVWLDEDKLNEIAPDIEEKINKNELIEVSVGVFTEDDEVEGDWNGETYSAIARGHRPDHLAILTECVGACSCADGCGIRANKAEKSIKDIQETEVIPSGGVKDVPVAVLVRGKFSNNNQKEETKMADSKCTPCVEKKVGELIANSQGRWTDTDKDFLQTLSEEQLDKMMPIVIEKEKEVQVNVLSKEDQEALAAYKAEKKAKREQTIQDIQANSSKELWPDEVLKNMNDDTLKRVYDSVRKENVADYSLNTGFSVNVSSSEVEPLYPAGIDVEVKK